MYVITSSNRVFPKIDHFANDGKIVLHDTSCDSMNFDQMLG